MARQAARHRLNAIIERDRSASPHLCTLAAAIAALFAWFLAAKEALDLEWGQTIITVLIGWAVMLVISVIFGGLILGAVWLTTAAAGAIMR